MTASDQPANDTHYRCAEDGCPYAVVYEIPKLWCEWHWQLWFHYGDEALAEDAMRQHRALQSPEELASDGPQRPVTFPIALLRGGQRDEG